MKKVALSAAVLALSMMGCSDVGLDNSVASTSNAQDKMDLSFFKYEPTEFKDVTSSEKSLVLRKSGDELRDGATVYDDNNKYRIDISSNVYNGKGSGSMIILARYSDEWGWYYWANYVHMYVACVRDCDGFGNCRENEVKPIHIPKPGSHQVGIYPSVGYECQQVVGNNDDVGVVTYGAAVFENGTVAIQGATRKNLSNDMALLVYRNYILPKQLEHAGL